MFGAMHFHYCVSRLLTTKADRLVDWLFNGTPTQNLSSYNSATKE